MPFESLKFAHEWRPSQTRVIQAIDQHLEDKRLHVVAAPGAGKTTLGLEVFRRLRKRSLILSPTRIIRDQWIERLRDFCAQRDPWTLDWVSIRLDTPKTLTSITYQALHAQWAGDLKQEKENPDALEEGESLTENELNSFIQTLRDERFEVIFLDEAHHLRSEWWKALDTVCSAIPEMILVALTATPPYGAQGHEWNKYEALCGPIDEEISVPELVQAGSLCPHQDFVWAVDVTVNEKQRIREHDYRVSSFCTSLFKMEAFNAVVLSHPWLEDPLPEDEGITDPKIGVALLTFLKARQHPLPKSLRRILDLEEEDIPELTRSWWQALLEAVLYSSTFKRTKEDEALVDQIKKQLRSVDLLRRRELSLERSRLIERSLALSVSKIAACVDIHRLELKERGEKLRQVILTDFIRDEERSSTLKTGGSFLGAWPVFQSICSISKSRDRVALLTGRLSVIHKSLLTLLVERLDEERISISAMEDFRLDGYYKVSGPLNQLTGAFTTLLIQGEIRTLVGTRSLLGEGWDAPVVNSLVLASFVGSFMLTNQMRGRAIRIDKKDPDKVSSVWHLVALDVESPSGLSDYEDLRARFETFVGLSEREDIIESGLDRLDSRGLPFSFYSGAGAMRASMNNNQMEDRLCQRGSIAERWRRALILEESARVMPSVRTSPIRGIRAFHFSYTLRHLLDFPRKSGQGMS